MLNMLGLIFADVFLVRGPEGPDFMKSASILGNLSAEQLTLLYQVLTESLMIISFFSPHPCFLVSPIHGLSRWVWRWFKNAPDHLLFCFQASPKSARSKADGSRGSDSEAPDEGIVFRHQRWDYPWRVKVNGWWICLINSLSLPTWDDRCDSTR